MAATEPQNTSESVQTTLANLVIMTFSSDAFEHCSLLAPCFEHQLQTWREHGREDFYRCRPARRSRIGWFDMTPNVCLSADSGRAFSSEVDSGSRKENASKQQAGARF